ncbi:hypothetical protein [Streptomyces albus]|uniref:hypothetical protein n=1 Tax=Streptomyces sp. NRRL F-5917 TaxID=1463873 RepID=UPI0004C117F4|nr:hypothetical protein [Streptomyces sp. NRRL F-5917]
MTADVERDGYTAELTEDDLEIVYRGPRGRQLKKCPAQLAGAPGMAELSAVRRTLTAHRAACEEQALVWAKEGAHAPRALAEADPEWERALTAAGVPLTGEPGEDGLFARTYAGPHGRTLTQLLAEDVVPYRDMLMREDAWEPAGLFATGLPDPAPDADGRLPFPERSWPPTRTSRASPWRRSARWSGRASAGSTSSRRTWTTSWPGWSPPRRHWP